ncbi:hypothetical protein BJF78_01870 [Pseudonocardia sp. CNS-139]|nr:hypothetical protein BJF78_01870 [Pseudonocardia sp. CNS-139]
MGDTVGDVVRAVARPVRSIGEAAAQAIDEETRRGSARDERDSSDEDSGQENSEKASSDESSDEPDEPRESADDERGSDRPSLLGQLLGGDREDGED